MRTKWKRGVAVAEDEVEPFAAVVSPLPSDFQIREIFIDFIFVFFR